MRQHALSKSAIRTEQDEQDRQATLQEEATQGCSTYGGVLENHSSLAEGLYAGAHQSDRCEGSHGFSRFPQQRLLQTVAQLASERRGAQASFTERTSTSGNCFVL